MDAELQKKIEETVVEILKAADMEEMTEYKVRKAASDKLSIDLSTPLYKKFVRGVVESYLMSASAANDTKDADSDQDQDQNQNHDDDNEDSDDNKKPGAGDREYDDDGDLIICRLSNKRRVTIQDFRGKTLVSIREYYEKDGRQLPTSKGISLTTDQWAAFKKAVPAIEKAINKMESRLN